MKLVNRVLLSTAAGLMVAGTANANAYPSDISPYSTSFVYKPQPYNSSIAEPLIKKVQNFTGFYMGVGGLWTFFNYDATSGSQKSDFSNDRGGISLFMGYGYEFRNGIYLGGQFGSVYYPWSSVDNSQFNYPADTSGDYTSNGIAPIAGFSLDFTPGYEVINHLLIYGIVGVGVDIYETNMVEHYASTESSRTFNDSTQASVSLRLGSGIKYQLTENVLVNFNYVWSKGNSTDNGKDFGNYQAFKPNNQTLELGVAYKF
ncbi:outer membrane beta-barrel protein [Thiotrichales bacterium 19S11-10]|nr:outer membrane beta-barrel protein [Thiotrichales bacterium 19S11-10]